MQLKILYIGDPHIKISSLSRSKIMIEKIMEKVRELKPDMIVCLGDLLDTFSLVRLECYICAIDFLSQLKSFAPTYLIIGNHDRRDNKVFCTTDHMFNPCKDWPNKPYRLTIVDKPIIDIVDGKKLGFVPYTDNQMFRKALEFIPDWSECIILSCHQDFLGARYQSQVSTNGDSWEEDGLPFAISGHIHERQLLKNVLYVGAPMMHTHSDGHDKSLEMVYINDNQTFFHERIMINTPVYWTFRIKYEDLAKYKLPKHLNAKYDDMKLQVEGTVAELKGLFKQSKIKEWISQGIKIQSVVKQDTKIKPQDFLQEQKVPFIVQLKSILKEDFHRYLVDEN